MKSKQCAIEFTHPNQTGSVVFASPKVEGCKDLAKGDAGDSVTLRMGCGWGFYCSYQVKYGTRRTVVPRFDD